MSYSPVPANYQSDNDDQPGSAFQPLSLQLQDFDFGSPLGGRSRSGSKVKSSIHSGTSYEMVDSDTESNYDEPEGNESENQKGKGKESTGNDRNIRGQEHEIADSGAFVSSHSHDAEPMQGFKSDGQQQHHQQYQEQDYPTAHGNTAHIHPQITGGSSRLGLQLDDRADCNERGVSAHTPAAPPRHEYQTDNHNDHPRSSERARGGSHQQPPPAPQPESLDPQDPQFEYSAPLDDIHPVFRHSQSVPELPPVDVQGLRTQNDRDCRPATSASGVGDLFKDFDGVHFDLDNPGAPGFPLRNQQAYPLPPPPPPAHYQHRQSQAYSNYRQSYIYPDHRYSQVYPDRSSTGSQRSSGLVYYPAPVPAMLNLPPTLSKARANNKNSRPPAAESMEPLANSNRRSVAYPGPPQGGGPSEKDLHRRSIATMNDHTLSNRRSLANLPPALRASQFFDSQLPPIIPDLKEESAVAMLDSILDASTRAPAAAFTDHPIAGGSAPYTQTRNHSTVNNLGNYRNSVAINVKLHPGESPRSSMESVDNPDHHNHNPEYNDDDPESHLNPENGEYYDSQRPDELVNNSPDPSQQTPPTTLLAELESRKAQQRLRNRTAASAFPQGIRSTLLQLDAVTQVQQQHRRIKKTHLAWEEDPEEEERDEDVPLGVLFAVNPGAQKRRDDEIPLGLLMKKEMEDAEPLSKRRERLRMASGQSPVVQPPRMLDVPGLGGPNGEADDEEVEGETLKERMKRLKEKQQFGTGTLDVDFISPSNKEKDQAEKPEPEETLAQRRRRLQKEKQEEEKHQALRRESVLLQQEVKSRRNMADLLHIKRPQSFYSMHNGANGSYAQLPMHQQHGFPQVGMNMGMGGYGVGGPGLIGRGAGALGTGPGVMGGEVALDPKQREVVERWRASVM